VPETALTRCIAAPVATSEDRATGRAKRRIGSGEGTPCLGGNIGAHAARTLAGRVARRLDCRGRADVLSCSRSPTTCIPRDARLSERAWGCSAHPCGPGRRVGRRDARTRAGRGGIATKEFASPVATLEETFVREVQLLQQVTSLDSRRLVGLSERETKGHERTATVGFSTMSPSGRRPRRSRKIMAGVSNQYGTRPGGFVLWSPSQRDGRVCRGW
jgi:hypothetical protein